MPERDAHDLTHDRGDNPQYATIRYGDLGEGSEEAKPGSAVRGAQVLSQRGQTFEPDDMVTVKATSCQGAHAHRPEPERFVWHHVVPKACGGTTTADNITSLCDNCHYTTHDMLWQLAQGADISKLPHASRQLVALAKAAFDKISALGPDAVAAIPNVGGVAPADTLSEPTD